MEAQLRSQAKGSQETTLRDSIRFTGKGLFSGDECQIILHPAEARTGLVLRIGNATIPCAADYLVAEDVHTTTLGSGDVRFRSIEHLLSALYFCNVTNCVIEILSGYELPTDGSGACDEYVAEISRVGLETQKSSTRPLVVVSPGQFSWNTSVAKIAPADLNDQSSCLKLRVKISFPNPIGEQSVYWCGDPESPNYHKNEFTQARSFLREDLAHELPGGTDYWTCVHKSIRGLPASKSELLLMAFEDSKWLVAPRFDNEPAWHKLVDLVGDLTLLGTRLCGELTVYKPGHAYNHRLLQWLGGRYDHTMPVTAALD